MILSSCGTVSHVIPERPNYIRPAEPSTPLIIWVDIPGYYALNETDFDELQLFFDEYKGYLIKIDDILKLYEKE